ncbi:NAD-dependent epimerase/dehydratase family protein [Candidatus Parcubacteria bacterium]|nr:NAD-dependent epimerase/dehydratase family protein [Candidatus Parcubacteria bacterium]
MAKCLVTGGAGFIGSNLVDALIDQGEEVAIIDNLSTGKKEYLNPRAKFYEIDICSDDVAKVFAENKFDYVFHLAAQMDVRASVDDPITDNKINVLGGFNILKQSKKNNIKKFIFTSTGGAVYGDAKEIPTTEQYLPHPVSPYGIHKLTFEKYLSYFFEVYKLPYIALRFSNVYGPRQYKGGEAGVISIFIDHAVNDKECVINGDGKQTRDFIYISDIIEAILAAKKFDHVGVFNVSDGRETNLLEIVEYIEKSIGCKLKTRHAEAKFGEQKRSCLDYGKIRKILSWEPKVGLIEGIKKTIKWSREQLK